jgi:dipeptidyl aminopeptidase/acylaminoacyl peptidase
MFLPRPTHSSPGHLKRSIVDVRNRIATFLVLGVAAVLLAAAVWDGTQDDGATSQRKMPSPGLAGTLWYATAGCDVARIDLATLRSRTVTTDGGHCRFWPSPDGTRLAMHVGRPFAAPERIQVLDVATGRITEPVRRPDFAVAPPAWSDDGARLATCDGSHPGGELVIAGVRDRATPVVVTRACFPGYTAGRLVYRRAGGDGAVVAGSRVIADAGTLGDLLGTGVAQVPGIAAARETVAVPATRLDDTATTAIVFYDPDGRASLVWDTGVPVREVALLAGGRVAAYRASDGIVARLRAGGPELSLDGGAIAVAASPDGSLVALSDRRSVQILEADSGRVVGTLDVATRWLAWT